MCGSGSRSEQAPAAASGVGALNACCGGSQGAREGQGVDTGVEKNGWTWRVMSWSADPNEETSPGRRAEVERGNMFINVIADVLVEYETFGDETNVCEDDRGPRSRFEYPIWIAGAMGPNRD